MATITGYTAERMKEIEDSAVISGEVVGDELFLTRYDATTINAGNVRGPQGDPGDQGDKGDKGDAGTSVTILGSYASEAALIAAHPAGDPGDAYLVEGDLYVWSDSAWENVGTIQGPEGPQGLPGPPGTVDPQLINDQVGVAYTLVAADAGKLVTLNNAAAITVTVPQDADAAIPLGSYVDILQGGLGQVTVIAGTGATLQVSGLTAKARAQYSRVGVQKIAASVWSLFGDLAVE